MANLVTNAGFANIANAWHNYAGRARYLQWGEGSGQTASDNAIDDAGSTTEARTAGSTSVVTENATDDTMQITGTVTAAGSRAITELGVFDAAGAGSPPTGGNLGVYGDFGVLTLNTNDSIAFTVRVTFQ